MTTILGSVADENGNPIQGASVQLRHWPVDAVESGADGSFAIPDVKVLVTRVGLTAEISGSNPAFGAASNVILVPDGQTDAGVIVIKPTSPDSMRVIDLGGRLSASDAIRLIWIEPGTFLMGLPPDDPGIIQGEFQQSVTLTQGYWLGETEVSQAQWRAVMTTNPSRYIEGDGLPVEEKSWEDCMKFCSRLTERERLAGRLPENMAYTLPTEAQWEFACRERGQSRTFFHFGNTLTTDQANFDRFIGKSVLVGSYTPNALGLYDMHGNVAEWCRDVFGDLPSGALIDPYWSQRGLKSRRSWWQLVQ
ncbi:MAG: SUMF1/EgtB/PvdO family nonheme iron enzyme [Verrucomicrobia bacterium]|nr:SUMF1/EgtB/PvdO family nonheme iron enzyme [Verrucomicrobiota bacterium]